MDRVQRQPAPLVRRGGQRAGNTAIHRANGRYLDLLNKIGIRDFDGVGQSAPAIAPDGTVYVVAEDLLNAYPAPM